MWIVSFDVRIRIWICIKKEILIRIVIKTMPNHNTGTNSINKHSLDHWFVKVGGVVTENRVP
jgi:hypothetical protein